MGSFEIETVAFSSGDTGPVEEAMAALEARGLGWINLGPGLRDDQIDRLPAPSFLGRWFSGRGPVVPMATWTPAGPGGDSGRSSGKKPTPAVVGVAHGAGPKALDQLRDAGLDLPEGWRKVQDHAKRGIVVEVAPGAGHADVAAWLVSACWSLCPIEIDDEWLAEIHRPR